MGNVQQNKAKLNECIINCLKYLKKHVKKKRETAQALAEINENTNWTWYDEVKKRWKNCGKLYHN